MQLRDPGTGGRSKMKVALLLPDGVGVRNFLLGSFAEESKDRLSLAVFATVPDTMRRAYENCHAAAIDWFLYRAYADTPALFLLRNTVGYGHTYSVNTFGMRCLRDLPIGGSPKRRAATLAAKFAGRWASALGGLNWVERQMRARVAVVPETAYYRELFRKIQPEILLSSNHRPSGVLPAVLAARSLQIPTATCIFSWDNLTSKGRIAAPFDHYFVWGTLMQEELLRYYPEIARECVHVVGAPQFDPHANSRLLWSRAEFCSRLGIDPTRPILCYSAGDPTVQPEEPDYVALLMRLIHENRIKKNPNVVLRPSPTADVRRFDSVRRQFPEMIFVQPAWVAARPNDWAQMLPLPADVVFLANLAHHADININIASTMTLDFAIHDRPVVNVAFDISSPPPFGVSLWDYYYQFEHYRPVLETGAALCSRSVEEFVDHLNLYLADPSLHTSNRRRFVGTELSVAPGEAGRRMIAELLRIGRMSSSGVQSVAPDADSLAAVGCA